MKYIPRLGLSPIALVPFRLLPLHVISFLGSENNNVVIGNQRRCRHGGVGAIKSSGGGLTMPGHTNTVNLI